MMCVCVFVVFGAAAKRRRTKRWSAKGAQRPELGQLLVASLVRPLLQAADPYRRPVCVPGGPSFVFGPKAAGGQRQSSPVGQLV